MTSTFTRMGHLVWLLLAFVVLLFSARYSFAAPVSDSTKPAEIDVQTTALHLPPLGLRLREMSAKEREDFKVSHGIMVVVAVGAAAIAGVREDDIILAIDKKPVTGIEQFWLSIDATKWKCTLQILRKNKQIDIAIGGKDP